jgi:hypothetical protein
MSVQFQDGSGERSPNSEDMVREADLGDPGDTGSTGAPGSEGEAPRLDDGGSEPPGYESDPGRDDSSTGSALPSSGPTFGDLVDLTGPERCRVRMSLRGKTIVRNVDDEATATKPTQGTPIVGSQGSTFG